MIITCGHFWLYSKVFRSWETCQSASFSVRHLQAPKNNPGTFHRPAGAQRLRRPAWKRQSPCGFMMFHMCDAQKHSRQHASMADSRQNDTWPAQPNGLHLKLARASSALCHDPIISHRVRGMRNKNQFISLFLFLEPSLASPTSPYYNRTHSSAVRESSQYAPNLPHSCRSPSGYRTLTHSKRLYF